MKGLRIDYVPMGKTEGETIGVIEYGCLYFCEDFDKVVKEQDLDEEMLRLILDGIRIEFKEIEECDESIRAMCRYYVTEIRLVPYYIE